MGLDMYLEGHKFLLTDWDNPENNLTEDGFRLKEKVLELGYWRKEPNLHGFIVNTFAGGKDECQDIELGKQDMLDIISAVRERRLPQTSGFFFGASCDPESEDPQEREWALQFERETIATFEAALAWTEQKADNEFRYIVYRASW